MSHFKSSRPHIYVISLDSCCRTNVWDFSGGRDVNEERKAEKKLQRRNNKIALLCYAKPLRRLYFMNRDIIIISLSLISSGDRAEEERPTTYMYPHLRGSLQPRFNLICPSVSRALVRKAANREIQLLSSHTTPHPTSSSVSTIFRHKLVSCWKKYVALSFTILLLLSLLSHTTPPPPLMTVALSQISCSCCSSFVYSS